MKYCSAPSCPGCGPVPACAAVLAVISPQRGALPGAPREQPRKPKGQPALPRVVGPQRWRVGAVGRIARPAGCRSSSSQPSAPCSRLRAGSPVIWSSAVVASFGAELGVEQLAQPRRVQRLLAGVPGPHARPGLLPGPPGSRAPAGPWILTRKQACPTPRETDHHRQLAGLRRGQRGDYRRGHAWPNVHVRRDRCFDLARPLAGEAGIDAQRDSGPRPPASRRGCAAAGRPPAAAARATPRRPGHRAPGRRPRRRGRRPRRAGRRADERRRVDGRGGRGRDRGRHPPRSPRAGSRRRWAAAPGCSAGPDHSRGRGRDTASPRGPPARPREGVQDAPDGSRPQT